MTPLAEITDALSLAQLKALHDETDAAVVELNARKAHIHALLEPKYAAEQWRLAALADPAKHQGVSVAMPTAQLGGK
jgi:hypothetical protein